MPAKTGYSVPDLTSLKNIDDDIRLTGYMRSVVSEKAWFMFIENATDTADDINIVQPTTGTGRWFKLKSNVSTSDISGLVESIQDTIANGFLQSDDLSLSYNDAGNTLSLAIKNNSINDSMIASDAAIAQNKIANLINSLDSKANTNHTHTIANIVDFTESLEDIVSTFLFPGTNISLVYDDLNGKLTINSTASGGGSFSWDGITTSEWDGLYGG